MRYVVISGGPNLYDEEILLEILPDDFIICADGGANHAKRMGLIPDKIIGDMDSIDDETLVWAKDNLVLMEIFPPEKDFTDSELCLMDIPSGVPVLMVLPLRGRFDHVLSNMMLAGKIAGEGRNLTLTDGRTWIYPIKGPTSFIIDYHQWKDSEEIKELSVSLLPLFGPVENVTTWGLVYPLKNQTLIPGSSFSVSNRIAIPDAEAGLSLSSGILAVIITKAV
jgi:thiamine pyrophosphokinase